MKTNIKPQVDKFTFANGNAIFLLAEGRLVKPGLRHRPPVVRDVQQLLQPDLAQIDLWANKDVYGKDVYRLPKKLDEEVARLHLEKIGVKLTKLTWSLGRLSRRAGGRPVQAGTLPVLTGEARPRNVRSMQDGTGR
ncbi:adenosylhomocysteinase [Pseudoxanthomonas sp. NC8]|nr:adenosylhomocysteinase [Pseudoxanthomonas sp. NC8]